MIEIFSSIQGEGKYVGCRQIFIRLADCNLNCAYCDTDYRCADYCKVETAAGSMTFRKMKNPLTVEQVAEIVYNLLEVPTQALSITGGEPLIHWQFIRELSEAVRRFGLKILLETNGTLYDELSKVLDAVDIISMDIKLPSVVGKDLFELHRRFLEVSRGKEVYVKIVVTGDTTLEEFLSAVRLVASIDRGIMLIIQPVTPCRGVKAISTERLLKLQGEALREVRDVRVIPQTHKLIGAL
ncbi:MAG: 7-carboxy-7-deazaguanine synthase QueE [Selenomonadaceae bacterium]|nr:7-carboxy-7-deazaguanine synthase QueE [Selenomonadaceae bacterium]